MLIFPDGKVEKTAEMISRSSNFTENKMQVQQFTFEKLKVWQLSRILTVDIYSISKTFPGDEKFGLISQLRRAAISVNSNIAEGSTRTSPRGQAYFYTVAFSSLMELFNHLILAYDLRYLKEIELQNFRVRIKDISVRLTNLKSSLLNKPF